MTSTGDSKVSDITIVTEVPPSLHKALLLMVKNFFSREHFLVVYYIMRSICIREENLRNRLNFDQRQLRQLLAGLKAEKLVKERLLQQKNENGRSMSIIFYFINYRAIINVLKYKIDHMRQRLEAREKEDVQKANYKCDGCGSQYDVLDIDRIFDLTTGTLKCWRCQSEVTLDDSGGPTQSTRTLLARFNEQMLPLFAAIRELAGIQLAPHLLEPDINQFLAEEDKAEPQHQLLDFSSSGGIGGTRAGLGGIAHSYASASINYANADQISVNLNADSNSKPLEEKKIVPMWLQDDAIGGGEHEQAVLALGTETTMDSALKTSNSVSLSLLAELEGVEEPESKRIKTAEDEDVDLHEESDGNEEEYETVEVQGKKVPLSDITAELVAEMTEEEREKYAAIMQDSIYY